MLAGPVLVYSAGDTPDEERERVDASASDPRAGRTERDGVHPAIESVAEDLLRPATILLGELLGTGLLTIGPSTWPIPRSTSFASDAS
jgi:hypothetical protein